MTGDIVYELGFVEDCETRQSNAQSNLILEVLARIFFLYNSGIICGVIFTFLIYNVLFKMVTPTQDMWCRGGGKKQELSGNFCFGRRIFERMCIF